jgi:hypothetical protein
LIVLLCLFLAVFLAQTPRSWSSKALGDTARSDYTFGQGYIEAGSNGGAYAFGNANYEGSTFSVDAQSAQQWLGAPIVGVAALSGNNGYFMAANDPSADYAVTCAFGAAQGYVSYPSPGYRANWCDLSWPGVDDIVGVAVDNANNGYWLLGSDGGVFALAGAPFDGSPSGTLPTGQSAVAIAATHDGGGYWVVTNGGYVYSYGDAQYENGMGGSNLNCAIVGMTAGPNDSSYWLDGCDGGVFSFGQSAPYGSLAQTAKFYNIDAMTSTSDGNGFYLMAFDGSIATYGDAQFQGDLYGNTTYGQIAGVAGTT